MLDEVCKNSLLTMTKSKKQKLSNSVSPLLHQVLCADSPIGLNLSLEILYWVMELPGVVVCAVLLFWVIALFKMISTHYWALFVQASEMHCF